MGALISKRVFIVLISLIIISGLITSNYFDAASMTAYFLYVICIAIATVFAGLYYISKKKSLSMNNPMPVILLSALAVFYFVQYSISNNSGLSIMHFELAANIALLLICFLFFKSDEQNITRVYKIIFVVAAIESAICLFQFSGLFGTFNKYYAVTGTWVNPNVTAMFITMAFPAALSVYFSKEQSKRVYYILPIVLISVALVLLKCRTALIGAAIISFLICNEHYSFVATIKAKYPGKKRLIPITLSLVVLICVLGFAFYAKEASSKGRLLIWKVSAGMIGKKPVSGYGYGRFDRDYNLAQAEYFAAGRGSASEVNTASFVSMGYNELLQNAVEGGAIAFVLLSLFFISLLITKPLPDDQQCFAAHAGTIGFIAMSLFNFTIQAIPAMCLFMVYVAVMSLAQPVKFTAGLKMLQLNKRLTGAVLILGGIILFYSNAGFAKDLRESKRLSVMIKNKEHQEWALQKYASLQEELRGSDSYWKNYGDAFLKKKEFRLALDKYQKASTISSFPDIYLKMAFCCEKLGVFDSALSYCKIASNVAPSKMAPRYAMMEIYHSQKDTGNLVKTSNQILSMVPKVKSKESEFYNEQAMKILKNRAAFDSTFKE